MQAYASLNCSKSTSIVVNCKPFCRKLSAKSNSVRSQKQLSRLGQEPNLIPSPLVLLPHLWRWQVILSESHSGGGRSGLNLHDVPKVFQPCNSMLELTCIKRLGCNIMKCIQSRVPTLLVVKNPYFICFSSLPIHIRSNNW